MELDFRHRRILQICVESYVENVQPVSSSAVCQEASELRVSPATVRAVMAELEAQGLLYQPHSSAGRVPTERGLRVYLDGLMNPKLRPWDRAHLEAAAQTEDPSRFPALLGMRLAGLSGQMALVAVPKFLGAQFREVGLVRCGVGRFLAFFVAPSGLVQQKLVCVDFDLTHDELQRVQNFLNERLANHTIDEVRTLVRDALAHVPAEDPFYTAWVIGERVVPDDAYDLHVEGTAHLAEHPEFADVNKLRPLLQAVEQKEALLQLMERLLDGSGVRVLLGSEHDVAEVQELACVGGRWSGAMGHAAVSLLGPPRMDYGRLVPLVGYATELLGRYWKTL